MADPRHDRAVGVERHTAITGRVLSETEAQRLTIGPKQPAALEEGHQGAIRTAIGVVLILGAIALVISALV